MKKIIIYDSDHPGAVENKCFEADYVKAGPGHSFTVDLATEARARGYEIMTADVFLKRIPEADSIAYCITDMTSTYTDALLKKGAIPFLCFSTESPLIAKDFYTNIQKLAGRFVHNLQFKGTAERLIQTTTQFSVMYYPVDSRIPLIGSRWNDRNFLILINRNKRAFFSNQDGLKNLVRSILSRIKLFIQKIKDPWIRSREIYKDRIEAIYFFSRENGFHLFGQGWENPIPGFSARYHNAAKRCFKGSIKIGAKLETLSLYKFSICFENCSFPGYITEKIFDCFLAGCIPIYLGAPDIQSFVPEDSFIDFRKFNDFEKLALYLKAMDEQTAAQMLYSAQNFLASAEFDKHYQKNIINGILNKVDKSRP